MPEVLVNLFQIILLQPIKGAESQKDIIEPLVVLEVTPSEGGKVILFHKAVEYLIDIAVIDRERQGIMVAAVF